MDTHAPRGPCDQHYRDHHVQSSGRPNEVIRAELAEQSPGRALDVGCSVGEDAIWLASLGWQVTGVDVSQPAVDIARTSADRANVTVEWICADIRAILPAPGEYDLVSVQYPALPKDDDADVIVCSWRRLHRGERFWW